MPSNTYPFIAREGWPILILLVSLYLISHFFISNILGFIFLIAFFVGLYLFRDPNRLIPAVPLAVVSPVHGRVVSIEEVDNCWLKRPAKRIRIKMAPWDIYSLRSPTEGKIMDQWQKKLGENGKIPEYAYWIKTDECDDVVTVLHFDKLRHFYRIYFQSGHRVGQGQRCGYIFLGATIDILLPINAKPKVKTGQRVESGTNTLALLVHSKPASAIENSETETEKVEA